MDSGVGGEPRRGAGPHVEFTGLGTGQAAGSGGWGGFLVFFVIPIVAAVLVTTWAERRVQQMWLEEQQRRQPPPGGVAPGGTPGSGSGPARHPGGSEHGDLAQRMWAEYQSMRAEEEQVLQELIRLGPAESWDCDPAQKQQVLEMLQRITPEVYRQWQARVSPRDSHGDRPEGPA